MESKLSMNSRVSRSKLSKVGGGPTAPPYPELHPSLGLTRRSLARCTPDTGLTRRSLVTRPVHPSYGPGDACASIRKQTPLHTPSFTTVDKTGFIITIASPNYSLILPRPIRCSLPPSLAFSRSSLHLLPLLPSPSPAPPSPSPAPPSPSPAPPFTFSRSSLRPRLLLLPSYRQVDQLLNSFIVYLFILDILICLGLTAGSLAVSSSTQDKSLSPPAPAPPRPRLAAGPVPARIFPRLGRAGPRDAW